MPESAPHTLAIEAGEYQILRHPREASEIAPASKGDDRLLHHPGTGIVGVFDGIGGDPYGDVAAEIAKQHVRESFLRGDISGATAAAAHTPKAAQRLAAVLTQANWAIHNSEIRGLGHTTATVFQFVPRGDNEIIGLWAHIGDSSAFYYDAANEQARKLTIDEGNGNRLERFLGVDLSNNRVHTVLQCGALALSEGDWIVLATDGVTDMYAPSGSDQEIIDPTNSEQLATAVLHDARSAGNAGDAAHVVVANGRKNDDATAMVFRIHDLYEA